MATMQELEQQIAKLQAENTALKTAASSKLSLKVSERTLDSDGNVKNVGGGVQLNGLRRFPVTFYWEEWEAIFAYAPTIKNFINTNKANGKLQTKAQAKDAS